MNVQKTNIHLSFLTFFPSTIACHPQKKKLPPLARVHWIMKKHMDHLGVASICPHRPNWIRRLHKVAEQKGWLEPNTLRQRWQLAQMTCPLGGKQSVMGQRQTIYHRLISHDACTRQRFHSESKGSVRLLVSRRRVCRETNRAKWNAAQTHSLDLCGVD
jgi:hypothetical protein